jgi:SAM-dependent methyltransferase
VDLHDCPALPVRAWNAWRVRGTRYAWHKTLRRTLGRWPGLKRRLIYADPRHYWTLRGGVEYFREQEGQAARTARARWLAGRIAAYRPTSVLEIGCGYGKQLQALREHIDVPLVGVDFSPSQLDLACVLLRGIDGIGLALASGAGLPFADRSFDLVMTSAVILHNPPPVAEAIRLEVMRVGRRWAAHNEDTDVSYNRFGYDTAACYRSAGIPLAESGPIPVEADPSSSQFCVAELWHR